MSELTVIIVVGLYLSYIIRPEQTAQLIGGVISLCVLGLGLTFLVGLVIGVFVVASVACLAFVPFVAVEWCVRRLVIKYRAFSERRKTRAP